MKHKTITKFRQVIFFLFSTAISSSCVNNIDDPEVPESQTQYPVILSAQLQQSPARISTNGFETDDAIGIYMLNHPNKLNEGRHEDNIKFTYSEEEGFKASKTLFFNDENIKTDFIGYYPYKENAVEKGKNTIEISVDADQSTIKAYNNSDFLVANTYNIEASNDPVDIVFKHKLSRLDIKIIPNENYTAEQLKQLNPIIKIKDVFQKATYDFTDNKFTNLNTINNLLPHGTWEIVNGALSGKHVLIIPQNFSANYPLIEIAIDGQTYSHQLKEVLTLNSGKPHEMNFVLEKNSNEARCVLNARIDDWGEITKQDATANEVSTFINTNNINWGTSNIYKVLCKGEQVAEITKEYLKSDNMNAQAIIIYPIKDGKADLSNGSILELLLKDDQNIHGGTINWNSINNNFTYTLGTSSRIKNIYITESKEFVFSRPENALQVELKADMLIDTRDNETIIYPLVKIGTQYWMRSNLKTTRYADGGSIVKGTNFADNTPMYCTFQNSYFFYNSTAVSTGNLAPDKWRISNNSDWEKLKEYTTNNTAVLKGGQSWAEFKGIVHNNLSGFNAVATGFFKNSLEDKEKHLFYWVIQDNNPKVIEKTAVISYNSNLLNHGTNTENVGYCIRCVRND